MPFITDNELLIWKDPTPDDVAYVRNRILTRDGDQGEDLPLPVGLEEKVAEAVSDMIPKYRNQITVEANSRFYKAVDQFLSSDRATVDIILPVHGAIHITEKCIRAVLERTKWPYHLTIVDDASDEFTNKILQRFANTYPEKITLITNKRNRGFAATVNRGMRATDGRYVLLLNSDVIVTPGWLTKMVLALEASPRNQIVNPVTNNTAIINVEMSQGASYLQMNQIFELYAARRYPEIMPTGFCFMFRRELLSEIGYFDEGFENYGEETDYWMKVITRTDNGVFKRWRGVLADDCYVFHERGSSYTALGEEEHMRLRKLASGRFHRMWPQFAGWRKNFNEHKILGPMRQRISPTVLNALPADYKICWVVHSVQFCGGMKLIADTVNELNERGVDAKVALIQRPDDDNKPYIPLADLRTAPVVFKNREHFLAEFGQQVFESGIVVAATAELAVPVKQLCSQLPNIKPLLHVQSYEPALVLDEESRNVVKGNFKLINDVISTSNWISQELKDQGVKIIDTVHPGVDQKVFYPRDRESGDERLTVTIPMIPAYHFKGYNRGVGLIKELWKLAEEKGEEIRILAYGTDKVAEAPMAVGLGALTPLKLANVLGNETDVFVDPSTVHSYGLPSLEALACGCAVVCWDNRGIREYAKQGKTATILANSISVTEAAASIFNVLLDAKKRKKMAESKYHHDMLRRHDREYLIDRFINTLEKHFKLRRKTYRVVMVTPHLRKHGGPTTIVEIANGLAKRGHNVSITSVYPDINPEVAEYTELPIDINPENIPPCDFLITNSDNPLNDKFAVLPQVKKKIMLKLSHNERFKAEETMGMVQPWDHVITSTGWLKKVCGATTEGWEYEPFHNVTRVGWWHYNHAKMKTPPGNRTYGGEDRPISIATLIHHHPLKGTVEAGEAMKVLKEKYKDKIYCIGIGEVSRKQFKCPTWMEYVESPNRGQMANALSQVDIWLGASHTEGLGRMGLEAMSAGAACVLTDTGAEYAKNLENCILVPIGDHAAMIEAIEKLLDNPDLARRIRIMGYRTAEEMASPDACLDTIENVFEKVLLADREVEEDAPEGNSDSNVQSEDPDQGDGGECQDDGTGGCPDSGV